MGVLPSVFVRAGLLPSASSAEDGSADGYGSAGDGSLVETAMGVSAVCSVYSSGEPGAGYDSADGGGYAAYESAGTSGCVGIAV